MLRCLFVIAMLLVVTACSELRIIGSAAMKEFKTDGIHVEQSRLARN